MKSVKHLIKHLGDERFSLLSGTELDLLSLWADDVLKEHFFLFLS